MRNPEGQDKISWFSFYDSISCQVIFLMLDYFF